MGQAKRRAAEIAELKKQGTMVTVRTLGIGDEDDGSDVYLIRGSQCAKMVNDYPEHARALIKGMPEGFLIQASAEFINRMQQDAIDNPRNIPARLYHVTYAKNIPAIMRDGLIPRSISNQDNYSDKSLSSHPEHVYLTEGNMVYYLHLLWGKGESRPEMAVIEVDTAALGVNRFHPDEDWVARYTAPMGRTYSDVETIEDTMHARDTIEEYKYLAKACLTGYGNIAYRGTIPPSALRVMRLQCNIQILMYADYTLAAYPYFRDELLKKWAGNVADAKAATSTA